MVLSNFMISQFTPENRSFLCLSIRAHVIQVSISFRSPQFTLGLDTTGYMHSQFDSHQSTKVYLFNGDTRDERLLDYKIVLGENTFNGNFNWPNYVS